MATGADESTEILAEAHRILAAGEESALTSPATLGDLAALLADIFDESYTAERVLALLTPARRRALTSRFAAPDARGGAGVWLPAEILDRLRSVADTPLDAIRALLDSGRGLPEPGSEEHCRKRRCAPEVLLSDPGGWQCRTCGLTGRVDLPPNPIVAGHLTGQRARIAELHALAAAIHDGWGAGARFTVADAAAHRQPGIPGDRDRLKALLADLLRDGLLEEAPGPRGGAGYRVLEEPPDWLADALAERRHQREAEARVREDRAAALRTVLENGLTHVTAGGELVEIAQNDRGLELRFPAIPSWDLRERDEAAGPLPLGWTAAGAGAPLSPVTSVEPWLAAALDAGATVAPLGTADPDAEDWGYEEWPD
ncbi:hypothetical protein [Azospirillum sp. B506]|uniref:hypothetical protein n=1 Tax=Azospirillum sp. B506 TaxID=137721 RepID=UPI0003481B89|nr:hypothetical protein [Azospirillum sp. B506]